MIGNTMTAARLVWKLCLFCAIIPLFGGLSALGAAMEYIVVDRLSGLAISGFDDGYEVLQERLRRRGDQFGSFQV